jgi:hypothetical protein
VTSKEAERLLDDYLTQVLGRLGFERIGSLSYRRRVNQAIAGISFILRWDAGGFAAFTCGVGVRFEAFDRWLNEDPSEVRPTLGTGLHLLREDRGYTEWKFSTPEQLSELHDSIVGDLMKYAIPFIERFSHVDEAVKAVAAPDPRNWFNWNVNTRVNFLAVARLVKGDSAGATKMLDDALLERKDARPKERFEIEQVRKRLASKR